MPPFTLKLSWARRYDFSYLSYLRKTHIPVAERSVAGSTTWPCLAFGKGARHLADARRGGFSGVVKGIPGDESHGENISFPLLGKLWMLIFFFLFFQVSTHYGTFVVFLDSESEWLLARGRAMKRGQIKMTTEQQNLM